MVAERKEDSEAAVQSEQERSQKQHYDVSCIMSYLEIQSHFMSADGLAAGLVFKFLLISRNLILI